MDALLVLLLGGIVALVVIGLYVVYGEGKRAQKP